MMLDLVPRRVRTVVGRWIGGAWRPSLLLATAAAAGVAAIANAVALTTPPPVSDGDVPTRLGTSIAQSMRDRDRALDERNRALDLREQAARAAEHRLRTDMDASRPATNATPDAPAGQSPATAQDGVFDSLARIYQTMRPNKAAPIFEKLALDVQVQVAKRMRDRQTAQIMAAMAPDAAVDLSMALAGRQVVKAPPAKPQSSVRNEPVAPAERKAEPTKAQLRKANETRSGSAARTQRRSTEKREKNAPTKEPAKTTAKIADEQGKPAGPAPVNEPVASH